MMTITIILRLAGAKQDDCAIADAWHFGVGLGRAYKTVNQVRKTCNPFGWLGSTPSQNSKAPRVKMA